LPDNIIAHLASGTKIESYTLSFTGQLDLAFVRVKRAASHVLLELGRRMPVLISVLETRHLEVGRQRDSATLTFSSGDGIALRVGL